MRWPWPGRPADRLAWVQVEVTTRCQARCRYCPRASWEDRWLEGDLDPAVLEKVLPELEPGVLVHLQGWGEPFLHPGLASMVEAVTRAGCRPTTTTNGLLLDGDAAERLADAGLEILGVSLAGTDPAINDPVRRGAPAGRVLGALEAAAGRFVRRDDSRPRLHVAYMLLRSTLAHLPRAVGDLASAGADTIVVSSLDLVTSAGFLPETFWTMDPGERDRLERTIRQAEDVARKTGVELVVQLAAGGRRGPCPERPDCSVFIGVDGSVFACVHAGVPVRGSVTIETPRGAFAVLREPLGTVTEDTLEAIRRGVPARRVARAGRGLPGAPLRCRRCTRPLVVDYLGEAPPVLVPPYPD